MISVVWTGERAQVDRIAEIVGLKEWNAYMTTLGNLVIERQINGKGMFILYPQPRDTINVYDNGWIDLTRPVAPQLVVQYTDGTSTTLEVTNASI